MHFTREPIIETVITAREGFKLSVRPTKLDDTEEYIVDAVEVVSFGTAIFFRSLDKPKAFLLPVNDYQVSEVKETKVAFKNVSVDKAIKIGQNTNADSDNQPQKKQHQNRKKQKKKKQSQEAKPKSAEEASDVVLKTPSEEEKKETIEQPPVFSRLFPPPPTLIKEKLSKEKEAEILDANILPPVESTDQKEVSGEVQHPSEGFPEPEPLDQPIFNPDFFDEKEETVSEEEVTKSE